MALNFNLEEGPFLDDTTAEEWKSVKRWVNDHPNEFDRLMEDYPDDPHYVEYKILQLISNKDGNT
jgi:hypothetical protein